MNSSPFIGIAGNIGVGKTTFTGLLGKKYSWDEYYESVIDNPYLSDFYSNMERWSFNLQIYFLQHRFSNQIEISNNNNGVIQDRTIYEDVKIFAKNLHDIGSMSDRDWQTYKNLFKPWLSLKGFDLPWTDSKDKFCSKDMATIITYHNLIVTNP